MGERGPLPDRERQKRVGARRRSTAVEVSAPSELALPARPPVGLGPSGRAVWRTLRALEWTQPSDRAGIERLAQLEDERALLRKAVDDHGPMLTKPVVAPKGDVVGTEVYANPALRELRRIDVQIAELFKGFGLTPVSRARLGVAVIKATRESVLVELLADRHRATEPFEIAPDD